ncbi:hypothetical protein Q7C36_016288 [Tachysurus vachellii]|uniref:Uncharacterized protein n=1 Tax=Tachysurus vachellii TaxID=175792 RepID=A0AA88M785_TACVA|nr:hypothetical protein Q7C36_016288 [Tachysurus vachellii]
MESSKTSGFFIPQEKVPVQCMDDPFGFNAVVVYGDKSVRLNHCTPFFTIDRALCRAYEVPAVETGNIFESRIMQGTSSAVNRGQPNVTPRPVWPEDTDAQNYHNQQTNQNLIFTDGGSPLTMATGGMGNYKPRQMESHVMLEEEEGGTHPRKRMKKGGKRGGKKSRRKQRA